MCAGEWEIHSNKCGSLSKSFLHQQWEKMPKGKKENCELGLCQVELATDLTRKVGFDRSVKWWKS